MNLLVSIDAPKREPVGRRTIAKHKGKVLTCLSIVCPSSVEMHAVALLRESN